jgi:hypothetical protein
MVIDMECVNCFGPLGLGRRFFCAICTDKIIRAYQIKKERQLKELKKRIKASHKGYKPKCSVEDVSCDAAEAANEAIAKMMEVEQ